METKNQELLDAVQQLALSSLQIGKVVKELKARVDRLEHVVTVDAVSKTQIPSVLHTERDIIS